MRIFFAFLLSIFHFIRTTILTVSWCWQRHFGAAPQPLRASRRQIPKHLAILFVVDISISEDAAQEVLTKSVVDAVSWCRTVGINKLTVYEKNDLLSKCTQRIRKSLCIQTEKVYPGKSETNYPITPPPSDYSESPPLSPNYNLRSLLPCTAIQVISAPQKESEKHELHMQQVNDIPQNNLFLCLISRESSKPAIAFVAQTLAQKQMQQSSQNNTPEGNTFELSVAELEQLLEDEDGLSAPDLMIIHHVKPSRSHPAPPELHCFPPWHIRLTEIYQNKPHKTSWRNWLSRQQPHLLPLDEISFRGALDGFTSTEMRFGK